MAPQVSALGVNRIPVMYQDDAFGKAGSNPRRAKVVKAPVSMDRCDSGNIFIRYSPANRIGSRDVEITVIGSAGKRLK